ncbi:MAG: DUF924 family protein [Paralcaligenes sp.]
MVRFWREAGSTRWFTKDTGFDQRFRDAFFDLHFSAARREHDHWQSDPCATLALILLLDQFPRNAFRGSAHMYATDSLARFYARAAMASNTIAAIEDGLKSFICLPFMHSESVDDQRYALELYRRYSPDDMKFAQEHCEIIRRFGRFPHRNAELGRSTTSEEQVFLDAGGFAG